MFGKSSRALDNEPKRKKKVRPHAKDYTSHIVTTFSFPSHSANKLRRHRRRSNKKAKTTNVNKKKQSSFQQKKRRQRRRRRAISAPPRRQRGSHGTRNLHSTTVQHQTRERSKHAIKVPSETLDVGHFFHYIIAETFGAVTATKFAHNQTRAATAAKVHTLDSLSAPTHLRLQRLKRPSKKRRRKIKSKKQEISNEDDDLLMSCDDSFVRELLLDETPKKKHESIASTQPSPKFRSPRRRSKRTPLSKLSQMSTTPTVPASTPATPAAPAPAAPATPQPQKPPTPMAAITPIVPFVPIAPIAPLSMLAAPELLSNKDPFVVHTVEPSELTKLYDVNNNITQNTISIQEDSSSSMHRSTIDNAKGYVDSDENTDDNITPNASSAQAQYIDFIKTVLSKRREGKIPTIIPVLPRRQRKVKLNKATASVIQRIQTLANEKIQKEKKIKERKKKGLQMRAHTQHQVYSVHSSIA